jgi:hypothetical protein
MEITEVILERFNSITNSHEFVQNYMDTPECSALALGNAAIKHVEEMHPNSAFRIVCVLAMTDE